MGHVSNIDYAAWCGEGVGVGSVGVVRVSHVVVGYGMDMVSMHGSGRKGMIC